MSAQTTNDYPQLDANLSDRMRKCLQVSKVSVTQVAIDLGVKRNTVGTWINGKVNPPKPMLMLWALRFAEYGVTLQWLQTGEAGPRTSRPAFHFVAGTGFEPVTSGFQAHHLQIVA
jgi:transcriptional regulator with XRE-family HTH domain